MATDLRDKLPFHRRLFISLLLLFALFLGCFLGFQYSREKHFRAEVLDAQMQLFNRELGLAIARGESPEAFVQGHRERFDSLRVTVISPQGEVLYESERTPRPMANHLDRPEVRKALASGHGYTIQRLSRSVSRKYFYSATRVGGIIVRTALPYDLRLVEVLRADRHFLWFMLAVALGASLAGYLYTRRLGLNIARLRRFAQRADRGERIDEPEAFLHDELGEISDHIVRLYTRLQQTRDDLCREHETVLRQEQEKVRLRKQLTNNINHELKTPVSSIRGYLETLLDNPDLPPDKARMFLEKGYAQSERLVRLLGDVATLTRMDEASVLVEKRPLDLRALIREVETDAALRSEPCRLRFNSRLPDTLPIEGNPSLLHSIFANLADNAAAYSGGRDIFLSLVEESEEHYLFSFADNGIGIDEEHLPRIFERFYRIDTGRSRKMGGTGLGLAIVKNAVLLHGGTISARNREAGGLEFRFTLRKRA